MKRVLIGIGIVALIVIAIFEVVRYRRFHPPEDYSYTFREDIDIYYYDQALVSEYFETGRRIGAYAREMWSNEGVDVRFADPEDTESREAAIYYGQLQSRADYIGNILARSQELKDDGFSNAEIMDIESSGQSPSQYRILRLFGDRELENGDKGESVWELQGALIKAGYSIPHDGKFYEETRDALADWQGKNGLYPSGKTNPATLRALFK